jgi:hypothetical protein
LNLLKPAAANVSALPEIMQQRLQAELKPGESLAWAGQPNPHSFFKAGFVAWLFFIPWAGLSTWAMLAPLGREVDAFDFFFSLGALFSVLIGLYGLGTPWRRRRMAGYTVYAITSERAMVIEGIGTVKARSFPRTAGPQFACTERADGTGDLMLELEEVVDSEGSKRTIPHGFFAIAEVAKVAALFTAPPGATPKKSL